MPEPATNELPESPSSSMFMKVAALLVILIVAATVLLTVNGRSTPQVRGRSTLKSWLQYIGLVSYHGRASHLLVTQVHLKQLGDAIHMYASKWNDVLPDPHSWPQTIATGEYSVSPDTLESPYHPGAGRAYAFNAALRGKIMDVEEQSRTVMMFESNCGGPAAGGMELLPMSAQWHFLLFVDGHVESVAPDKVRQFIWDPRQDK